MHPRTLATTIATLVITCTQVLAATPTSMAGYWPLDDTAGSSVVIDESEQSNGVVRGNVYFGDQGVNTISTSVRFQEGDGYIEIPHHDDYLLNEGTISFWFRPTKESTRMGLLSKDSNGSDTGGHISIWIESNNHIKARIQSTTTSYEIETSTSIVKDQWHHVAVVFGPGGFELYLDGMQEATDPYAGGLGDNSGGIGNFEPITLGTLSWLSGNKVATPVNDFVDGNIDDLGILSERWSSATIADLFARTGPGTTKNLGDFATVPVFFVRTRGSDSNDGLSPQTSFRTIQKAINNCTRVGTTVYVGSGTYQESIEIGTQNAPLPISGTSASPIRLIGDTTGIHTFDTPGAVTIDGRAVSASGITLVDRTYWVFQGLTLRNQVTNGIHGTNAGMDILDCTIDVPAGYAVFATATGDITVADCVFERSPGDKHTIWITPNNTTTPTSVTITRNDATLKGDLYLSTGLEQGWSAIQRESWGTIFTYGIVVFGWGQPLIDRIEVSNNQLSDCYLSIFVGVNSSSFSEAIIANNTITGAFYSIYSSTLNSGAASIHNNIIDTSYLGLITYTRNGATVSVNALIESKITASMSQYQRSFEFDIIHEAPMYTDAPAGEFSLVYGSAGIDAGTELKAPSTDIAGLSRPTDGNNDGIAQINIGAHELVTPRQRVKIVQWREIGIDSER